MKALAAINAIGWLVAVPVLLVALVDPFVDFGDWPDRLIGDRGGAVQLRTPEAERREPLRRCAAERRSSEDDPLQAAREAVETFNPAPAGAAPLAAAPGGGVPARRRARPGAPDRRERA